LLLANWKDGVVSTYLSIYLSLFVPWKQYSTTIEKSNGTMEQDDKAKQHLQPPNKKNKNKSKIKSK